jgi:hypothetical protein
MTPTNYIRLVQAAILAAIVGLCVGANAALGTPMPRQTPDAFERYVAAHPYGSGVIDTRQAPDLFERYVSAHPYGSGVIDTGPAPDLFERYIAAHAYGSGVIDTSQAPDVFERYVKSHGSMASVVVDGRSPDTRDAARTVQPVDIVTSGGFDWSDAGIGAAIGGGLMLLMGGSMLLLLRTHRRHDVQAT